MDSRVYFDANMEEPAVVAAFHGDKYSIRWTGTLIPPATGDYVISARTGMWNRDGKIVLTLDGKEMNSGGRGGPRPAGLGPGQGQGMGPGQGGRRGGAAPMQLEGGHRYSIKVEYTQNGRGGGAELNWIPPAPVLLADAEKVAKGSDAVLVFVGLNGSQEGEGHDRSAIDLPEPQEGLVKAMIATGKPVVVILTSGSAVAINSAAAGAAAVLSAWYGGEEAGSAIADTLAGVNNPAGRLPVTFYKSLDQVPEFTDYSMKNRTYRYFKGEPLYPFGYGLSYSTFAYSGLNAKRTAGGAEVSATVKNTSSREGDEVVQLYIGGGADADAPIRNLRGFQRIHLKPGESRQVKFTVDGRGRAGGEGGCERWRRAAHRQHAVCEGFPVAAGPKTRFRLKGFMRRGFIHSVVLVSLAAAPLSAADPVLWYRHPASRWGDALPIGNGRLGGMVFGGIAKERIALNEDTIWNGKKRDRVNPEALKALPEVRRLLFEGKVKEAEALEEQKMMGIPNRQPPYQPLGDLNIEFTGLDNAQDYRRELNLATGVARVSYRVGDTACTREVFSSAPDQAIVVRLSCDKPGQLTFRATLTRSQDAGTTTAAPDRVILAGEAIAHTNFWISPNLTPEKRKAETDQLEPSGVRFRSVLRAVNEGGKVEIAGADVVVTGANAATLLLVAATDYRGGDPAVACDHYLTRAAKSYDALKSAHLADHERLFRRVEVVFAARSRCRKPSHRRTSRLPQERPGGSRALGFILPIRTLPSDGQQPSGNHGGQSPGDLERTHVSTLGQ